MAVRSLSLMSRVAALAALFSIGAWCVGPEFSDSPSVRSAVPVRGEDFGARMNALYGSLPATGGVIRLEHSATFSVPIVFGTKDKPVLLVGLPGDIVTLTFTGGGTAMTFDYGTGHRVGHGLRDLTLKGPGANTATVGVQFGGANGAEGFEARDVKIESFGTGAILGSHTWLVRWDHSMLRDSQINLLLPGGLTEAGEQIVFTATTFADSGAVWVQSAGEVIFRECSFDQAPVRIGHDAVSAAQVVISGSHFENPNFAWPGAANYSYLVIDDNPGNLVRLTDSYMLQDALSGGPDHLIDARGGRLMISGLGLFTPRDSPLQHLAILGPAATVEVSGVADLSGNIRSAMFAVEP